jgi:hypothetical protein
MPGAYRRFKDDLLPAVLFGPFFVAPAPALSAFSQSTNITAAEIIVAVPFVLGSVSGANLLLEQVVELLLPCLVPCSARFVSPLKSTVEIETEKSKSY